MIRLGPGGTAGLGYLKGIEVLAELGLTALEVEFTYGVRMTSHEAKAIGRSAKRSGIMLSVHAPYYINLASFEPEKIAASKKRIIDSCMRAEDLGARYVVFHAGFYQKKDPNEIYNIIRDNIVEITQIIKENNWKVKLAPEVTGKKTQFGSIDELKSLMKETGCHITIDFAHQKARNNGNIAYSEVFDRISELKHIHAHFSGIEWTSKGEKRHILTSKEDILPLAEEIVRRKTDITIINESPDPINDSVMTKSVFEELGWKF